MSRLQRMTPRRLAVLRAVQESADHPTSAEIRERAQKYFPRISRGTVYNALAALARAGEVVERRGGTSSRYDAKSDRHDHALCIECGRMLDISASPADPLIAKAIEESGYRITGHHTEYYGYCPTCAGSRELSAR